MANGTPPWVLSAEWEGRDVGLYLGRCQIDTPPRLVAETWRRVHSLRAEVGATLDFGAGDGRFAHGGRYASYVGFEVDERRMAGAKLPTNASIEHRCAFSADVSAADLCIGNPPFVRNQDLPEGWRGQVAERLERRSGIRLSGLANAWQYFFLLSLLSVHDRGLCALVIPYEWVSRPSVAGLRRYVRENRWHVDVYRLCDQSFDSVLTTASITIVDKANLDGVWRFHETGGAGNDLPLRSSSGAEEGHLCYARKRLSSETIRAVRGLSPGTQRVFALTEGERARLGLRPERDVRRCVTSLRHLPAGTSELDARTFNRAYREAGARCWLVDPAAVGSSGALEAYLGSVDPKAYATATCLGREVWWQYVVPPPPAALVATCFKGGSPKAVLNTARAVAVGGVAGIHGATLEWASGFVRHVAALDLRARIVTHANQLMKLETGQLNTLISDYSGAVGHG